MLLFWRALILGVNEFIKSSTREAASSLNGQIGEDQLVPRTARCDFQHADSPCFMLACVGKVAKNEEMLNACRDHWDMGS